MAFNGIGHFSIAAGQSFRLDGWSWPDGADHGAQYFSAHPLEPNGKLVITEQNKTLGADGRTTYGFRVTNEGPNAVHFSVQGGGFINPFDVADGTGLILLNGGENRGAQFCSATPLDRNIKLVMKLLTKARLSGGRTGYGYVFTEEPQIIDPRFRVQGGGFVNGFNGIGQFTIERGASFRLDGWHWSDGADHGAQYFAADPEFDSLVSTEQNKMLGSDGRFSYGFRVTCPGDRGFVNGFSVQGGGFV